MTPNSEIVLAVAGSRKTQSIIDECVRAGKERRILILTYTKANQDEIGRRLDGSLGLQANVEVMGWFSFLITHIVRPFLPFVFPGQRVQGFDFDSKYQRYESAQSFKRYFNGLGQVRRVHLAHLARLIIGASSGTAIARLGRLYDQIYIDEVQDLCGWDLEVLDSFLRGGIALKMVGDVRQAILSTNPEERKHKQFKFMPVWRWFKQQELHGLLEITTRNVTWRCRQEVADFADGLFDKSWAFGSTISNNARSTPHDGMFAVWESDVAAYVETYRPLFLRDGAGTARGKPYSFLNIGVSKGLSSEHVAIWPTKAVRDYLGSGKALTEAQASSLYVAVTRAEQSVGFVVPDGHINSLERWEAQ
jgi:DNA helicase-2/ATP-dependent DNA helicase PcrA